MDLEIIDLGASKLDETNNVLTVQAGVADDDDFESYDDISLWGQLGITARPYPADDSGAAQGLVVKERDGLVISTRDTRTADVYGQLQEGDVAIHSTGPKHASRIFLKEDARSVILMSKDSNDKDILITVDGKNDKIQIAGFKCAFEMSPEGITVGASGLTGSAMMMLKSADASVWLNGSAIHLDGAVYLGPTVGLAVPNPAMYALNSNPATPAISANVFVSV